VGLSPDGLAFGYRRRVPDRVLRNTSLLIFAALLGKTAAARAARGDATDRLFGGSSVCPTPAAVRGEVETLVPRDRLNTRLRAAPGTGAGAGAAPVEVTDQGAWFRVVAAGSTRDYHDEPRDCAHRARIAAVFVVLVVDPAAMVQDSAPPAPPAPPPAPATTIPAPVPAETVTVAAPPAAAIAATPSRLRVGVGGTVAAGVGADARLAQLGAALRVGIGSGRLALSFGAALLTAADATIGGVRVHHRRIPFDASVRIQRELELGARYRLQPYAELGVGVAEVQAAGLDLATRQSASAVELGAHGAVGLYLAGLWRLLPFLQLHAEWVPAPPAITTLPRGVVGHTPLLWLGADAGLAWGWL
jgi:hypothetical protein